MNKRYELVAIFDPALTDTEVSDQVEKISTIIKSHDGEIEKNDLWGRRELAYEINRKTHGIYVVLVFNGKSTVVTDLKRQLRINESVMRSLIVKKDQYAPDLQKSAFEEKSTREAPDLDPVIEVEEVVA